MKRMRRGSSETMRNAGDNSRRPSPLTPTLSPQGRGGIFSEAGFTLMEMLVVLVLIGLIAMVAIPQVSRLLGSAKGQAARIQMETLSRSLSFYQMDNGDFPTAEQGLAALWQRPGDMPTWNGPYVREERQLSDPWGRPVVYRLADGRFTITTLGADGREGGTGEDADISMGQ